jgi:hypothetical protein
MLVWTIDKFVRPEHTVSTFSTFRQYLHPFEDVNILFFTAWPMLGACFTLYYDTLLSVGAKGR